jgi:ABC-2 type transport system permease protein
MKPRRVWAVARKEFLHVLRDYRSLAMGILIPMIMLVLFGYALTLDVDNVPIVVWDQSSTSASRDLLSRFSGSPYFAIQRRVDNYRDVQWAIDCGDAVGALVIPRDFAARERAGRAAPLQFIVDGSDANTATIVLGYATTIAQTYSQDLLVDGLRHSGKAPIPMPLDPQPRVWFNEDLEGKNYIVPGLIAVIMMIIAALLTSLCIAREWERGTMEQLISTPVKGYELILGKLVPYFAIGMFDMVVAVVMGVCLFHVPLLGNLALLFAMSAVFLVGVLSMGILISITTKSQLLASQLAMVLTFLPAFLLSGFLVPIQNMPRPIQWITQLIPARYFVALLRGIYLKGVGVRVLGFEIVLLSVFGLVMLLLANLKFQKKLT